MNFPMVMERFVTVVTDFVNFNRGFIKTRTRKPVTDIIEIGMTRKYRRRISPVPQGLDFPENPVKRNCGRIFEGAFKSSLVFEGLSKIPAFLYEKVVPRIGSPWRGISIGRGFIEMRR